MEILCMDLIEYLESSYFSC